jgi:hypothetical protein
MTGNQVVSTMFDIKSSIHMARIIPSWDREKDPGLSARYVWCFAQVVMEIF